MDYDLAGYGSGVGQCHSGRIALQAQINEHSLHTKLKNGQLLSDTLRSPAFSVVWRVGQCLSGDTRPQGEAEGGNDNRSSSPVVVSKSCVWAAHHQAAQRMSCSAGVSGIPAKRWDCDATLAQVPASQVASISRGEAKERENTRLQPGYQQSAS